MFILSQGDNIEKMKTSEPKAKLIEYLVRIRKRSKYSYTQQTFVRGVSIVLFSCLHKVMIR